MRKVAEALANTITAKNINQHGLARAYEAWNSDGG